MNDTERTGLLEVIGRLEAENRDLKKTLAWAEAPRSSPSRTTSEPFLRARA